MIKSKEELQKLLQQIPTNDLAEALAGRSDVSTLRQRGVHVLMIQQSSSQNQPA